MLLANRLMFLANRLLKIRRSEAGQGLTEYALILALVSITAVIALGILSGAINDILTQVGNALTPP